MIFNVMKSKNASQETKLGNILKRLDGTCKIQKNYALMTNNLLALAPGW